MMEDLIMELVTAVGEEDKAGAYEQLERLGIDRKTADEMAGYFYGEVRTCA